MNNTTANRLQNPWFSKKADSGHTSAIKIRETALYSLEGSIESNCSKETFFQVCFQNNATEQTRNQIYIWIIL